MIFANPIRCKSCGIVTEHTYHGDVYQRQEKTQAEGKHLWKVTLGFRLQCISCGHKFVDWLR